MSMPRIADPDRKKPLCYDPERKKFISFDDILSGEEKIIPLKLLSASDLKRLVLERQRVGPDYKVQSMSGPAMSRDDVVGAITRDEPFGLATIEAEAAYLNGFLAQIAQALNK